MEFIWAPLRNGHRHAARRHETAADAGRDAEVPRADIVETRDAFRVELELPGYAIDEIDVTVEGSCLTVRAERKHAASPPGTYHLNERRSGVVERAFALPATVDSENTKAEYTNGILSLELGKRPEAKPRTIPIASGD